MTQEEVRETGRVEAFSDGVFAIAITLLVLGFTVPPAGEEPLAAALWRLWPSLVAFALSFLALLTIWVNHHGVFRAIQRVNGPLLAANGVLLLAITFVPFPTAVLAQHLLSPSATTAAAFYCGTYVAISLAFNGLWAAASRGDLLRPEVPLALVQRIARAYRSGLVVYGIATGLALWSPYAGLGLSTGLWLLWGTLDYSHEPKPRKQSIHE